MEAGLISKCDQKQEAGACSDNYDLRESLPLRKDTRKKKLQKNT
jgi:hypothetical protein